MIEDARLLAVFHQVFHQEFHDTSFSVKDVADWDSMSHIKLIMTLESEFDIEIGPEDIRDLYSDFATVRNFVVGKTAEKKND